MTFLLKTQQKLNIYEKMSEESNTTKLQTFDKNTINCYLEY